MLVIVVIDVRLEQRHSNGWSLIELEFHDGLGTKKRPFSPFTKRAYKTAFEHRVESSVWGPRLIGYSEVPTDDEEEKPRTSKRSKTG